MEIQLLHMLISNSYQTDYYHSNMNQRDYNEFKAKMPNFPCFTLNQQPVAFATQFCNTLAQINSIYTSSVYFPIWLHDTLCDRPLFFIDNIDDSIFGGDPPSPRLIRPRNAISSQNASFYEERLEFYLTGYNPNINPKQIQTGIKMISREIYNILAKSRVMNLFTGKFVYTRIINMTTVEVEVHTVGTIMQFGVAAALQDHFLKQNPRTLSTFHLGTDIPDEELNEIARTASQ